MRALSLALLLTCAALPALAQGTSVEDKLREALRRSTVDLRALQDSQGTLQAERDAAVKQRDLLQQQLTEANAKLAQPPAAPVEKPPDPEELKKLHALLDESQRQISALTATNAKWQAAYQQAAALAQAKDAEAKRLSGGLLAAQKENQVSHETNKKLAVLAHDFLHLYETQDFRSVLLRSYEPVLGLGKVKLDNMVQDYEDKVADLRIYQTAAQRP